ncbi:uncharacterized protein LOC141800390 [Halichoeres trimaculatus]|uniref:uncharacterized protein LOC141800390 n=1 Tax=Halichoeres trimaculatus TaxID=147232 RepID=UPI003D9EE867
MAAVQQLLLETLHCLSERELSGFKDFLVSKKGLRTTSSMWRPRGERLDLVDQMMETYGHQSVELTRQVLEEMNRTDLIQMLSESSSEEKHFVDRHQPTHLEEAVKEDAERILFQTLWGLSFKELEKFRFLQKFTYFQRSLPQIKTGPVYWLEELVDRMVENQHPVEVTKEVLMDMNRSDLVERLSGTSSELKERRSLDWLQTVETATSVTELLMETLAELSKKELQRFTTHLEDTWVLRHTSYIPWLQWVKKGHQETVFSVIMTFGQHSVEITREILKKMKKTDLVQRLSDCSSTHKKKDSYEQRSALIQKVATMSAVQQLLLETLHCLSQRELSEFKKFLKEIVPKEGLKTISLTWRDGVERRGLVDQMMKTYGQRSVELTREVLEKMDRTDLIQMLSESSSALKEKHFVDRNQPTLLEEAVRADAEWILLLTLRGLSKKELEKFRFLLQFTYFQRSLPQIQTRLVYWLEDLEDLEDLEELEELVYLMVENQHPVEVAKEVLMDMNRSDLVERLSGTSSGLKGASQSEHLQKESTLTADHEQLLEILEKLSPGELEKFEHVLQYTKLRGLPKIPGHSMETADKAETVRLMVENYGQQSVEVTKDVLEILRRMDLVEKLSESSSGSQGPSGSLEPEACGGSTTDSSPWTKLEPGVNSSGGDESPTYSLQSETGNYECSVSGLRWVCEEEVSFQYHFRSWGGHMERMESIKYMPAGPLIDIKVITGRLNEVYLPHWICTEDDSKISDNFKVLHIDECGDVVENVSEVTPSHAKLSEPVFSPRGVLMKVGFPVKISCCVLIYYKPNTPFLKLRVYLIPCDPALQQTVNKKEFSKGFQTIEKPQPDKYLKMQKGFSLTVDIQTAEINPQKITLRYDNQDPNFYEVFIEKPDRNFQLELFYTSKKEIESEPVWTCKIREDDHQSPASEDKPSVDDQRSAQMQSLTNRMQALTTSTTDRERLLKILEDLTQEEFKEFKWYLRDKGVLADLTSISKRKLESKDVLELVDLMLGTYRKHCMKLTRRVLSAMNKNDLVETLSDIH